jgi:hypothetical protein
VPASSPDYQEAYFVVPRQRRPSQAGDYEGYEHGYSLADPERPRYGFSNVELGVGGDGSGYEMPFGGGGGTGIHALRPPGVFGNQDALGVGRSPYGWPVGFGGEHSADHTYSEPFASNMTVISNEYAVPVLQLLRGGYEEPLSGSPTYALASSSHTDEATYDMASEYDPFSASAAAFLQQTGSLYETLQQRAPAGHGGAAAPAAMPAAKASEQQKALLRGAAARPRQRAGSPHLRQRAVDGGEPGRAAQPTGPADAD